MLWGEDLPRSWEQRVRGTVGKLRSALRDVGLEHTDLLSTSLVCYQLHLPPNVTVDVERAQSRTNRRVTALGEGDAERAQLAATAAEGTASMVGRDLGRRLCRCHVPAARRQRSQGLGRGLRRPGRDVRTAWSSWVGADGGPAPGPVLDQQARRAYEGRIRDLQGDIDDARVANDPARAERASTPSGSSLPRYDLLLLIDASLDGIEVPDSVFDERRLFGTCTRAPGSCHSTRSAPRLGPQQAIAVSNPSDDGQGILDAGTERDGDDAPRVPPAPAHLLSTPRPSSDRRWPGEDPLPGRCAAGAEALRHARPMASRLARGAALWADGNAGRTPRHLLRCDGGLDHACDLSSSSPTVEAGLVGGLR